MTNYTEAMLARLDKERRLAIEARQRTTPSKPQPNLYPTNADESRRLRNCIASAEGHACFSDYKSCRYMLERALAALDELEKKRGGNPQDQQ